MKITAWLAGTLATLDPAPQPPQPDLTPIVLVHGLDGTGADMARLARHFRAQGRTVFCPSLVPSNGSASLETLAAQFSAYVDEHLGPDQPFHLIGYSMGGMVGRHYLQDLDGQPRVPVFITLSSPHHGTWIAHLRKGDGLRQMRRRSDDSQRLNAQIEIPASTRWISFCVPTDLIIVPSHSSHLPRAQQHTLWGLGHFTCIMERHAIRRVAQALVEAEKSLNPGSEIAPSSSARFAAP
ncbi:MAG: alpha/beta fold hydrolase [Verrucomicrobiales bacterium]|nr:alpha/beta fold hydrolase [Verrucomicrobiales bacterium]